MKRYILLVEGSHGRGLVSRSDHKRLDLALSRAKKELKSRLGHGWRATIWDQEARMCSSVVGELEWVDDQTVCLLDGRPLIPSWPKQGDQ